MKNQIGTMLGTLGLSLMLPGLELSAEPTHNTHTSSTAVAQAVTGMVSSITDAADQKFVSVFDGIPNPGDVTVTRENLRRVIHALQEAGLNRKQIKRWINASLDAQKGPDIPSPGDIDLTRENFKRVVHALQKTGLNRQQIKRWINASLTTPNDRPDIRRTQPDRRRLHQTDIRPAKTVDRFQRPAKAQTLRPQLVKRPLKPVRIVKPKRPLK